MKTGHLAIILLTVLLSACSSPQSREVAAQNRQSIDDALGEAAAVSIPEAESPSTEILGDLMPDTAITRYLSSASDCQYWGLRFSGLRTGSSAGHCSLDPP